MPAGGGGEGYQEGCLSQVLPKFPKTPSRKMRPGGKVPEQPLKSLHC